MNVELSHSAPNHQGSSLVEPEDRTNVKCVGGVRRLCWDAKTEVSRMTKTLFWDSDGRNGCAALIGTRKLWRRTDNDTV